jgi:hypothetical protein
LPTENPVKQDWAVAVVAKVVVATNCNLTVAGILVRELGGTRRKRGGTAGLETKTRGRRVTAGGSSEAGAALIVALLVMVIMTLLGIPFLLMGETENRIAQNERLSLQAVYAAEAGAHMVERWFDRPGDAANVMNPPLDAIDRSQRKIDEDGNPGTAPVEADGSSGRPYYKQADDAVFDKPYRGDLMDALLGTEDGPDMRIDAEEGSAEAKVFLEDLSASLFNGFPDAEKGQRALIRSIDVYAPPHEQEGGTWNRYGIATVKVTAGIFQEYPDGSERLLAERSIKFVLNELPYTNEILGPLRACGDITWTQQLGIKWGIAVAGGDVDLGTHDLQTTSLPRVIPSSVDVDLLWAHDNDGDWAAYYTDHVELDSFKIEDPWFRLVAGGVLKVDGTPVVGGTQPWPFTWSGSVEHGVMTGHDDVRLYDPPYEPNHSNLFQGLSSPDCDVYEPFPYATWKALALRGGPNVHYYAWDDALQLFRENGDGDPKEFRDHSTWGAKGLVYLNATVFHAHDVVGPNVSYQSPPEPFQDKNANGRYDAGEGYVNLQLRPSGGPTYDACWGDTYGGSAMYNDRGPVVNEPAMIQGVLYTNGDFDSTGTGRYYGAVVVRGSVDELSAVMDSPQIYWDASLKEDWRPADWGLPRVLVTRWHTDL